MIELEKIPEKQRGWTSFQKNYNTTSKSVLSVLGTNISLFVCIMLPILLIGFIWTDFGAPKISLRYLSDGIVTVTLFVIGEVMMMRVGADGGKLDADYVGARETFNSLIREINGIGTGLMPSFCACQIDKEIESATAVRLRALKLSREEFLSLLELTPRELAARFGKKKAKKIIALRELEPIELSEAALLYEDSDELCRGGIPISGEGHMRRRSHFFSMLVSCIFAGLVTVSVAITLTSDFSFARVMYTVFKLVVLLFRMATGYNVGARAYNTVEVRRLKVVCNYLREYIRFAKEREEDNLSAMKIHN